MQYRTQVLSRVCTTVFIAIIIFGCVGGDKLSEEEALYTTKGANYYRLGKYKEAIKTFDELVERFGDSEDLSHKDAVAWALVKKGITLVEMNRHEEAITTFDEVVTRFGESTELSLREQVAGALVNKGSTIGQMAAMGKDLEKKETLFKKEIALYDDVLSRFGTDPKSAFKEQTAMALFNKGSALLHQVYIETNPKKKQEILHEATDCCRRAVALGAMHYNLACALALSGELDEAFDELTVSLENEEAPWLHVKNDPDLDALRDDPRYEELKKKYEDD